MKLKLKIWRQSGPQARGQLRDYHLKDVSPDDSFLEMLDQLNEQLIGQGEDPVAFDHDCREGICGACSLMINGRPHGQHPGEGTTACQLHMRKFTSQAQKGAPIVVGPWQARAFPIIKDLMVDRSVLDKMIEAGGYVSTKTGSAPEANSTPIRAQDAQLAMDGAACIGCGACVAACPNASATLFVAAKVSHLALLPQGHPEGPERVANMLKAMQEHGLGHCRNETLCEDYCPKGINLSHIARMNREFLRSQTPRR